MRWLIIMILVGGCAMDESDGRPSPSWNPPPPICGCQSGQVCASNGGCAFPEELRTVHVMWTISGKPANADTCRWPDLEIMFYKGDAHPVWSSFGYTPVPCSAGRFTVTLIPIAVANVDMGVAHGDISHRTTGTIGATGELTIDLPW